MKLSLPMYQIGAAKAAYAKLGAHLALRASGVLGVDIEYAGGQLGEEPALAVSQVCGFPFQHHWRQTWVQLATPSFAQLPDVPPGHYRSVLIAQRTDDRSLDELRRGVIAVSEVMSQSGHHALLQHLAREGLAPMPSSVVQTGAHVQSLRAVAQERAELAAIDAVTFELLRRAEPSLCERVRVVAETEPAPGLPLVVRAEFDAARQPLCEALEELLEWPEAAVVGWQGWVRDLDYRELSRRRDEAAARGWVSLIDP